MQHSTSLIRSVVTQLAIFVVLTLSITGAWAAYVTLAPGAIATGQPVNAALMQQIKDNLDDLDARMGTSPSADLVNDGAIPLNTMGLSNVPAYYTNYITLPRGTYMAHFYNCLASTSQNYYLSASAEGASFATDLVWAFWELKAYTSPSFVFKVNAATQNIRFVVRHQAGGTITDAYTSSQTCSRFEYQRIGS